MIMTYGQETVRYLIELLERDIFGARNTYRCSGRVVTGDRARTADYLPLIGSVRENSNIIVAAGFNRVGLSLAPVIGNEVKMLMETGRSEIFQKCGPQRDLISFGKPEVTANAFAELTLANLIEHELISKAKHIREGKRLELFEEAIRLNEAVQRKFSLDSDFGAFPDALSILTQYNDQ